LSFVTLARDGSQLEALLGALDLWWPLVQPMSAEVIVGCHDREYDYPDSGLTPARPHFFVYDHASVQRRFDSAIAAGSDDGVLDIVAPFWSNPIVEAAPDLSVDAIRSWLVRAQSQPSPAPDTHIVAWESLRFAATRARVHGSPPPDTTDMTASHRDAIRLHAAEIRGQVVDVPLEWRDGSAWVAGPTRAMRRVLAQAPFLLTASNAGRVELCVAPNWSLWTDAGAPGHVAILEVGRAMLSAGWELDQAGWAFAGGSLA
jgi:hypothetical protein